MVRARLGENNTRITDDPDYMKNYMRAYYGKKLCRRSSVYLVPDAVLTAPCKN